MKKKQKPKEKNFYSYKKLWIAYKIARRTSPDNAKDPERIRYAKKLDGVARGLFRKKLIEKLPVFDELN